MRAGFAPMHRAYELIHDLRWASANHRLRAGQGGINHARYGNAHFAVSSDTASRSCALRRDGDCSLVELARLRCHRRRVRCAYATPAMAMRCRRCRESGARGRCATQCHPEGGSRVAASRAAYRDTAMSGWVCTLTSIRVRAACVAIRYKFFLSTIGPERMLK